MEAWYFAYGSNLLGSQLLARIGSAAGGGAANAAACSAGRPSLGLPAPEAGAAGVCQHCSRRRQACSASSIALPRPISNCSTAYESGYERRTIVVQTGDGEQLPAETYVMQADDAAAFGRPDADYLQRILDGAKQHGLPDEYLASIVRRPPQATRS